MRMESGHPDVEPGRQNGEPFAGAGAVGAEAWCRMERARGLLIGRGGE